MRRRSTRTLPGDDRARLERHLEDVREVERRIELAGSKVGGDLDVPVRPAGVPDEFEQHARLTFDLLALAWAADITRVGTLMIAKEVSNAVYAASGISDPFHNLSHHSEVPANIERYARLNAYHTTTTLAYFLGKLRDTPDGDGNLLDHSLVLYGSGMSNSNQHDHEPLPTIVAGGASGALAGGPSHPRGRRHAAGESAGRARAEARRRRRVVRRQHGGRFAVRRAWSAAVLLALALLRGGRRGRLRDARRRRDESRRRGRAHAARGGRRSQRARHLRHAGVALGRARRGSHDGQPAARRGRRSEPPQRARRCAPACRDREPRSERRSSCCWRRVQTRRSSIRPARRR